MGDDNESIKNYFEEQQLKKDNFLVGWDTSKLHPYIEEKYKSTIERYQEKGEEFIASKRMISATWYSLSSDSYIKSSILDRQARLFLEKYSERFKEQWQQKAEWYLGQFASQDQLKPLSIRMLERELGFYKDPTLEKLITPHLNDNNLLLYCEVADHYEDKIDYILDFSSDEDIYEKAVALLGRDNSQERRWLEQKVITSSLIQLKNFPNHWKKTMREEGWYDFPIDILKTLATFKVAIEEDHFLLTGEFSSGPKADEIAITRFFSKENPIINAIEYVTNSSQIPGFQQTGTAKNWDFTVYDVGCGSCSELVAHEKQPERIFFDFGADIRYKSADITTILNQLSLKDDYAVLLSHWDEDHIRLIADIYEAYRQLLSKLPNYGNQIERNTTQANIEKNVRSIKEFLNRQKGNMNFPKTVIAPALIPGTSQRAKIFKICGNLCDHFYCIAVAPKHNMDLQFQGFYQGIQVFSAPLPVRKSLKPNLNCRGIVARVEGKQKNALLPGDHSFGQLENLESDQSSIAKSYVLVIPHHGGRAGDVSKKLKNMTTTAILSTRKGAYRNLPREKVICNGFNTVNNFYCTDSTCGQCKNKNCNQFGNTNGAKKSPISLAL